MKNKIIVEPKEKPTFMQLRTWLAFRLVAMANWIRPGNEAAMSYFLGIMQEASLEEMLYGKSEMEIKVKKHNSVISVDK